MKFTQVKTIIRSIFVVLLTFIGNSVTANSNGDDYSLLRDNKDLLLISKNIYDVNIWNAGSRATGALSNYTIVKVFRDTASGFDAAIYVDESGKAIVGFGGTEMIWNDLETDLSILQRRGSEDGQFAMVREAMDFVSANYSDISVTGHSLGGSLAQYASLYSGVSAVTFNTAPMTTNIEALAYLTKEPGLYTSGSSPFRNSPSNIVNIQAANDPMTLLNELIEAVDAGRDPVRYYASLVRWYDPTFPTPRGLDAVKVRASALLLVASAKSAYGLGGIPIVSLIAGERIKINAFTGHSIAGIEGYLSQFENKYDYTEFPEIIAQTMTHEDPILLAGTDVSSIPVPQEWSAPTNDLITETTTSPTPTPTLTGPFYGLSVADYVGSGWSGLVAESVKTLTFPAATGDTVNAEFLALEFGALTGSPPSILSGHQDVDVVGKYSYLAWGKWSGPIGNVGGDSVQIISSNVLFGQTTPTSYIDQRTGTASYSGSLHPTLETVAGETLNTLSGSINVGVDFNTNIVSGNLQIVGTNGYNAGGSSSNGYILTGGPGPGADLIDGTNPPSFQVDWGSSAGPADSGMILGVFYGPEAQEIGGIFAITDSSNQDVIGTFTAQQ